MKLNRRNLYLLIILCGICGASIPTFAKISLESLDSGTLTIIRYAVALVILIIFSSIGGRTINWRNVRMSLPVSIFLAVNAITFAIAIRYIAASVSPLLYNIVPLMVVVLSWWILKDELGIHRLGGILLGLGGVILVALAPYIEKGQGLELKPLGVGLIFFGALTFSLFTVLSKPIQRKVAPAEMLIAISITTLACQATYMLIASEPFSTAAASSRSLLAALEIGVVGTVLFYGLYQYIIKVSSPVSASLMMYVQPVAGAIWALAILGDRLSPLAALGGLISLAGIAQVNGLWGELRKKYLRT